MFDRPNGDDRQHAPATKRNSAFIIDVLKDILPEKGQVLEIASGSGEHVVAFAGAFPGLVWQPSDPFGESRKSIDSWSSEIGRDRIGSALDLDTTSPDWPGLLGNRPVKAILAINMIHIAPWEATCGLVAGAGQVLESGAVLYTYGPYKRDGKHTSPSNENFEGWLKDRDPRFGIRDIADIESEAGRYDIGLERVIAMPANNFSLVFRKS